MTAREKVIFERALWMCAHEHGNTREQQLAWLEDDDEWHGDLSYPKPYVALPGQSPWIQVTRTTNIAP